MAATQEMICDQAQKLLDISLTDPHPRVHWAAIEAIIEIITDSHQEHVRYLNKFLPRLVTIIKSASIYPRVQFHAVMAVRHLINNCDNEDVKSFSEDLVPELLKFLQQGEKFREEAMEILRSLAVSFPALFRRYYQETVGSLKLFVSESLFGAKSIECLSYIFSGFLRDQSLSLLTDAQEALAQLCKLPQLVADKFLNIIMPVLIQTLENANNIPYTMTLTIAQQSPTCPEQTLLACDLLSKFADRFQEQFAPWASRVSPLLTRLFRSNNTADREDAKIASVKALPSVLLSCQDRRESQRTLFNFTVRALLEALEEEMERAKGIAMLKSLNSCIAISGSVLGADVINRIADLLHQVLSQTSFANLQKEMGQGELSPDSIDKLEQEEEIIQGATCLVTMINTLKSAFLTHIDELLPAVEALWGHDNGYPDKVKAVAISIFNLILKDYPDRLQRYLDTYALVVMELCYSESPQLQWEAARGIGLCATHRGLVSNFDAPVAIGSLYHVIECGIESKREMTYDAAVSALGKICEFRRDIIDGPQVVSIWLNFLPLRNDSREAKYAHQQLCKMLKRFDQDLLGTDNENLGQAIQILNEILLQSDYLATEETTCLIISLLSQFGALS
ncbi:importin-5-like [Neltuma alba]|uniref:importin-5-like n=1 Tax=Neltuma alba TaxID=207710 RepID=UPI0010A3D7EB|nr:importin-5-like [Prosopis alba]